MKIRDYFNDDIITIKSIYQQAFAGFPWYENLSNQEIEYRWKNQSSKLGFKCLVAEIDKQIVGASWWNNITIEELCIERGNLLGCFANNFTDHELIWLRETCVSSEFQNRSVATLLKQEILTIFKNINKHILLLTRMREDNIPIISINKNLGFKPSGIKIASSQIPGLFHEYWYKKIN